MIVIGNLRNRIIILFVISILIYRNAYSQPVCYAEKLNKIKTLMLDKESINSLKQALNEIDQIEKNCDYQEIAQELNTKQKNIKNWIANLAKPKDTDADGFPDNVDKCPNKYSKVNNGCPLTEKVKKTDNDANAKSKIKNSFYPNISFPHIGIYTGYFKENKRSGKGKMIYDNGDKYEGDWENDKRIGEGKITYANLSIFDGEWKNDSIYFGTYTFNDKNSLYTGEFKKDKKNGWGKLELGKLHFYEGEFKNDSINGWGTFSWWSGEIKYTGQWKDNKKNGFGLVIYSSNVGTIPNSPNAKMYCGNWKDDKVEGFGRCYDKDNRIIYEGEFKNDYPVEKFPNRDFSIHYNSLRKKQTVDSYGYWCTQEVVNNELDGFGVINYEDSSNYRGEWHQGQKQGQGELTGKDGFKYIGGYKGGVRYGWGLRKWGDGNSDEGEFNDDPSGWVTISLNGTKKGYVYQGKVSYSGAYSALDVFGKLVDPSGIKNCKDCITYIGEFKNGKMVGKGRCYDKNMRLIYEGDFYDDKPTSNYPNQ